MTEIKERYLNRAAMVLMCTKMDVHSFGLNPAHLIRAAQLISSLVNTLHSYINIYVGILSVLKIVVNGDVILLAKMSEVKLKLDKSFVTDNKYSSSRTKYLNLIPINSKWCSTSRISLH
jgi:hypothetical protein